MRIILSLSFLMASLAMQAQSYTITERVCRMWIDNPSRTVEVLLLDRIDWRKVGSNSDEYEFSDGISTVRLRDAYLVNYPTVDSLINQIEAWIDSCAIPPNLWPIQVCDTSNITVNGVVTDAATDASNDGEIAITTYGGQSPYTYAWTGPGGYTSTDEDITGLDNGTYTVTVTDANACTGSQSFEVGIAACDGVTITFTATVTDEVTEGAEDGEIEINTTSGGTGPYTYAWTGPNGYTSTSEDITDLADGDYTVTATDANGCTGDSTFTVGPGFPCSVTNITFTAVVTDESIDQQNDGEIDLTTAGGASPYTWSWRGPRGYTASTEDISNLGDGDYTVTATDANNCQGDTTFTIDPGPTICDTSNILFNAVVVDETIEGLEDGSIDLTTYGGTPPYTWLWRGPTGFRETTEDISNLADGDYTVTVTDNNGCQGDTTYTIDPGFPCDTTNIGFVAVITNASDSAVSDGEIDLTTYGGSKVYTWAWTGPGGYTATTEDITGLAEGEYTVTATDSNNCFNDTTLTVGVTAGGDVGDPPNLVLYYHYDNDSTDTGGITDLRLDNDGTTQNVAYDEFGVCIPWPYDYQLDTNNYTPMQTGQQSLAAYNTGLTLLGTNEYIETPDDDSLSFTTGATLNTWIYMNDATNFPIMYKDDEYLFWVNASDKLEARFIDSTDGDYVGRTYNTAITSYEDQWINVSAHFRNDTVDIYLNGIQVDDTDANSGTFGSLQNTDNVVQFGFDGTNYADGKIDVTTMWSGDIGLDGVKEIMTERNILASYGVDTSFGGFGWDLDGNLDYLIRNDNDTSFTFVNLAENADTAFSISVFISVDAFNSGFPIIDKFNATLKEWQLLCTSGGLLRMNLYDETTGGRLSRYYNTALNTNQAYHIVMNYDGSGTSGGIELYLNGIQVDDTNDPSGSYTQQRITAADVKIGYNQAGSYYANGKIYELAIFGRELTLAEIDILYNNHAPVNINTTNLNDDLIVYWRGYNSTNVAAGVLDQSGNGLNLTPTNMDNAAFAYTYPREIFDADSAGSFVYDGLSDYINVLDSDDFYMHDAADIPFSLSCWINVSDFSAQQKLITKFGGGSGNNEWQMQINGGLIYFDVYEGGNARAGIKTQSSVTLTDQWVHVVGTFPADGLQEAANNNMKIYINGDPVVVVASVSGSSYDGMLSNGTNPLRLGVDAVGVGYLSGSMAHATVIKGLALTHCQVQEIYNDGSPDDPSDWTFINDVTASHWNLNQSDDPDGTVTDQLNTHDGTSQNTLTLDTDSYPTN